jgi:hypothetical protein
MHQQDQEEDQETTLLLTETTTELEGKVNETISTVSHHHSTSITSSAMTHSRHENNKKTDLILANLPLLLITALGETEDSLLMKGERKLKNKLHELEKEWKIEKNRADIKASDLFRDHDKNLKLGMRSGGQLLPLVIQEQVCSHPCPSLTSPHQIFEFSHSPSHTHTLTHSHTD